MRITVLGAGYMGAAMAKVAAMRGHTVRLWGTWLDDAMLDPIDRGEAHPRLRLSLDDMRVFRAPRLDDALSGAESAA
jgi:glycerol-3-phosphate dehydrogenase (NAD(P)+)